MKNCACCGKENPDDVTQCQQCGTQDFRAPTVSTAVEWHYAIGTEQSGPIAEEAMVEKARSGQLDRNTKIWKEGLPKWILLGNSEFAKVLPNGKPPPLDEIDGASAPAKRVETTTPSPVQKNVFGLPTSKQYRIYENTLGVREAVKQGWSWPAFFFSFIWAFVKKMNAVGGGVVGGLVFLIIFFGAIENSSNADSNDALNALFGFVEIALAVVFGVNGNRWRELNLGTRGYQLKGIISAETDESALMLYAKEHQNRATDQQPILQ